MWLEVDRGSEYRKQIVDKLKRYAGAWEAGDERYERFPLVVFVVVDKYGIQAPQRLADLRRWITDVPEEYRPLFRVMTLDEFATWIA